MPAEKPAVTIGAEQLQEILSSVIEAARKPPEPTPEQKAAAEQDKEMRRQQAELVLMEAENKRRAQEACSHMRRDGSTPSVYVQDGNYLICQHCQKIVRPEVEPDLFNKLFQLTQSAATF